MTNHTPNSPDQHLPGVTAPDPNRCLWCGRTLEIIHYHYDSPYDEIVGYADRYECHCTNPACDAWMATGSVTTYPETARAMVASRKAERGSNANLISGIVQEWLPVLATTREFVK